MKPWSLLIAFMLVLLATTSSLSAAVEKRFSDEGELSYVATGGNTQVTTLAAKNVAKYQFTDSMLGTWKIGAVYGKTDEVKTAENYVTELRMDYQHTERLYSFVLAGWLRNEFAGIDRRVNGDIGAGYKILIGPRNFLLGELSVSYVADAYTDGTRKEYPGGRAYGKYTYAFTEKSNASQSLEYLHDFDDPENYTFNSETALLSALSDNLSLKASYLVNYKNRPVPSTLRKTDRMFMTALVINY